MEKVKNTSSHNKATTQNEATDFECGPASCAGCPLANLGCNLKFNVKKNETEDKPKTEVMKASIYTVMSEKTAAPRVVKEIKDKPKAGSKKTEKAAEFEPIVTPRATEPKKRFEDIWSEINSSYKQAPSLLEKKKSSPTRQVESKKSERQAAAETAPERKMHKSETKSKAVEQQSVTVKKTKSPERKISPQHQHKIESAKKQDANKPRKTAEKVKVQSKQERIREEEKPDELTKKAAGKAEKIRAKQEFSRTQTRPEQHERRAGARRKKSVENRRSEPAIEKPQIFLDELDVRIHDSPPPVFEPVLVINREIFESQPDYNGEAIEQILRMPPEQIPESSIDTTDDATNATNVSGGAVENARAWTAQIYDNYAEEITDINQEAYAATLAYEQARRDQETGPFIERAHTVDYELLDRVDIEHDNDLSDLSDALPPLAIDGITDPDLGIEKLRASASVSVTTTSTLWTKVKLKLARFLLRNVAPE
ncbi:hypothetical protein FWF93_01240 [Candidatus Saccharibacteria bacterium]|nr:hypothetical protein [Candidatus Saccharibacteria bacterium]